MTTYTTKENESFDAEILRQELVKAIGADGWYINTAGNQVTFVGEGFDPEATILAHFAKDRTADKHNAALDAQITALERQQLLPRITRDMHRMVTLQAAAGQGIAEADLLSEGNPNYSAGYARFYAFDAEIAALRASRV